MQPSRLLNFRTFCGIEPVAPQHWPGFSPVRYTPMAAETTPASVPSQQFRPFLPLISSVTVFWVWGSLGNARRQPRTSPRETARAAPRRTALTGAKEQPSQALFLFCQELGRRKRITSHLTRWQQHRELELEWLQEPSGPLP